jgi:hypothetical protein
MTDTAAGEADFFAEDDYPIDRIPTTPLWSENYAFNCFEPGQGIGFAAFLGRWWGDPTLWREFISLGLPGDRVVCVKNYGRAATRRVASASMFRVENIKPGQSLRLTYDGPAAVHSRADLLRQGLADGPLQRLRVDLHFEAVSPVWNMSGEATRNSAVAGALHIEQVGSGRGVIEFGAERYEIDGAFMNRDHSRGFRNMAQFRRHCWAQGWFGRERVSFNVYAIELFGVPGLAMSKATVSQGSRRYPATVVDIGMIRGQVDARLPFRFTLHSELGEMRLTRRRAITSTPIAFTTPWDLHHGVTPGIASALTFEESGFWDWDGCEGIGWSERAYIHEPFADAGAEDASAWHSGTHA